MPVPAGSLSRLRGAKWALLWWYKITQQEEKSERTAEVWLADVVVPDLPRTVCPLVHRNIPLPTHQLLQQRTGLIHGSGLLASTCVMTPLSAVKVGDTRASSPCVGRKEEGWLPSNDVVGEDTDRLRVLLWVAPRAVRGFLYRRKKRMPLK